MRDDVKPSLNDALDNVITRDTGRSSVLEMQTGLYQLAFDRARASGTTEVMPEDISALEDHARAMARNTHQDAFDPTVNHHDALHDAEYERDLAARTEARKGLAYAIVNLRDAESNLAKVPRAGSRPAVRSWIVAGFIGTIAVTCAPTLHDVLFHSIEDDALAWFASLVFASLVAGMVTMTIVNGRRTSIAWVGMAAGVLLGIGLGAVRLSSAEGVTEVLLAIGLTVVEIASVLLLEWLASGLRNSEQHWEQLKIEEDAAVNAHAAAQADLSRWQTQERDLDARLKRHIAMVEDRHYRHMHLPELEAVAVKAVRDGYSAGIAENLGRIRAAGRRFK